MPIRDRIIWGNAVPLSDPRLTNLDELVKGIRQRKKLDHVTSGEFSEMMKSIYRWSARAIIASTTLKQRLKARTAANFVSCSVKDGDVYITGDHYNRFRQIINMPT